MEKAAITTTNSEFQRFNKATELFKNQPNLRPSHLSHAISLTLKDRSNKDLLDEYEDALNEKRIDLAQKDKDGSVLLNANGTYKMKADGAKKFQVALRKLGAKEIKVTVYRAKSIPSNLALPWYDYFVPFVIADYPEPEEPTEESPDKE